MSSLESNVFMQCVRENLLRDDVKRMVYSYQWDMEEKIDGIRAQCDTNYCNMRTKNQDVSNKFMGLWNMFTNLNHRAVLDGEIVHVSGSFRELVRVMGQDPGIEDNDLIFRPFDITQLNGQMLHTYNARMRRAELRTFMAQKVPTGRNIGYLGTMPWVREINDIISAEDAMEKYDLWKNAGGEGVMLKRVSGTYIVGSSLEVYRSKYKESITCIPLDVEEDGRVVCGLFEAPNLLVKVCTVQVPADDLMIALHMDLKVMIEVEAQAVDRKGTLRHPVYKGFRYDQTPGDCLATQLDKLRLF